MTRRGGPVAASGRERVSNCHERDAPNRRTLEVFVIIVTVVIFVK